MQKLLDMRLSEIVARAKKQSRQFQDDIEDLVSKMEDSGRALQYIIGLFSAISCPTHGWQFLPHPSLQCSPIR